MHLIKYIQILIILNNNYSYLFQIKFSDDGLSYEICMKAFLSIHGISHPRLRCIQNHITSTGLAPKDKRGKHKNRPHAVPDQIIQLIHSHIQSFKGRRSHYSFTKNKSVRYLPESLSIKKMHKLFLQFYKIQLKYGTYYRIFTTKYNLSFGSLAAIHVHTVIQLKQNFKFLIFLKKTNKKWR